MTGQVLDKLGNWHKARNTSSSGFHLGKFRPDCFFFKTTGGKRKVHGPNPALHLVSTWWQCGALT